MVVRVSGENLCFPQHTCTIRCPSKPEIGKIYHNITNLKKCHFFGIAKPMWRHLPGSRHSVVFPAAGSKSYHLQNVWKTLLIPDFLNFIERSSSGLVVIFYPHDLWSCTDPAEGEYHRRCLETCPKALYEGAFQRGGSTRNIRRFWTKVAASAPARVARFVREMPVVI